MLDKQAIQLARDVIDLERMLGLSMRGAGSKSPFEGPIPRSFINSAY
jgi:hypothetical protein